jgi:hypothetical protein
MSGRQVNSDHGGRLHRPEALTRRRFLGRATVISAITAGVAGGADLVGVWSAVDARAATRRPKVCCVSCTWAPGHCNNGHSCPTGNCCYHCVNCGPASTACSPPPAGTTGCPSKTKCT